MVFFGVALIDFGLAGDPHVRPELFTWDRPGTPAGSKQFRRGLEQMEREGVTQVLRDPDGDPSPVVGAVGQMQFEVFAHRLEHAFGAAVDLSPTPHKVARHTDEATAVARRGVNGVTVLHRRDGSPLALFENPYWLQRLESEHPEWCLDPVVGEAG